MKKLMFVAALAASAAAFADGPINATAFANSGEYNPNEANSYFYFAGESNSSVVTNEPAESIHTKHTANFASATDANYLALDTEGGTLWRSLATITSETVGEDTTYGLGAAQSVGSNGIYLDTLVQFTVTEDEAPTLGADDKLAIWLQAGEGTTNLMVHAGWTVDGSLTEDGTNFVLSGVSVIPGEWYRLTVKAYDDILVENDELKFPAFSIFIDGTEVGTGNFTIDSTFAASLSELYKPGMASKVEAGTVFLSCVAGEPSVTTTLQGVGFQGTGAVDEIVWTEENPIAAATIDFTLTWGEGVSTVSYTLSTDLTTTNSLTSGTAVQLAPGDGTAMIELIPTFETDYEFDKVTMGETELGLTFAIPGVTTNATLVAKAAAPAYPTYIDTTDTAIKAKYDAWKQAVGFDDSSTSTHLNQFLLNVDESATVGDTALEITEIKQNATAGWDITIGCSLDGVALTGTVGETIVCNGYLAVSYTDDLTGTWTTENIPVTAVDATTGTVTVNVNKANAKFMKVTLTAAPQAAANN